MTRIDVTQVHTVGQEVAWNRVIQWLKDQPSNVHIEPEQTTFNHKGYAITLALKAYGSPIMLFITIGTSYVHILSNDLSMVGAFVIATFEDMDLKSQLARLFP